MGCGSHDPDENPRQPGPRPSLVIVGASVRSLAQSARRAGFDVHAVDLFRDRDLVAATVSATLATASGPYPEGLIAATRRCPPGPWCYTGALENHPLVIDRIARERPLAGIPGATVAAVRDHRRLRDALHAAGLDFPETHFTPDGLPTDGSFLLKPVASAGGRGIVRWRGGPPPAGAAAAVWQRVVPGASLAVGFAASAAGARLLGVSRQLVGRAWCRAAAFAYCGSVALPPETLPRGVRDQLERLGRLLAGEFGLRGLIGVDVVVDRRCRLHVIEVNPRPTASLELYERATGESLARAHLAACGIACPAGDRPAETARPGSWAKAVLFAERAIACDPRPLAALDGLAAAWTEADGWPALADIPGPGGGIARGAPIVTIFAHAATAGAALRGLRRRTAAVRAVLAGAGDAGSGPGR